MFFPLNFVFCSQEEIQHYRQLYTCQMIQDPLLNPTATGSHLSVSFCACHSHTDHMHYAQKALGRSLPKSERVLLPKLSDFRNCRKIAVPKPHHWFRKSVPGRFSTQLYHWKKIYIIWHLNCNECNKFLWISYD